MCLAGMLMLTLAGCASLPIVTADDPGDARLREAAAAHALALADGDLAAARGTGRTLIALLAARFGW